MNIDTAAHKATESVLAEMREVGFHKYVTDTKRVISHDPTVRDINNGWCEEWANRVLEVVEGAEARWLDEYGTDYEQFSHVVVQYKGRFYDAECPDGVKELNDIPMVAKGGSE